MFPTSFITVPHRLAKGVSTFILFTACSGVAGEQNQVRSVGLAHYDLAQVFAAVTSLDSAARSAALASILSKSFSDLAADLLPLLSNQPLTIGATEFVFMRDRLLSQQAAFAQLDGRYPRLGAFWQRGELSVAPSAAVFASDLSALGQRPSDLGLVDHMRTFLRVCNAVRRTYSKIHISPEREPQRDNPYIMAVPGDEDCVHGYASFNSLPEGRLISTVPDPRAAALPPGVGPVVQSALLLGIAEGDPE